MRKKIYFSLKTYIILIFIFFLYINYSYVSGNDCLIPELSIFKVNLAELDNFKNLEKGSPLAFVLLNDISTKKNEINKSPKFKLIGEDDININASGYPAIIGSPGRFSMSSLLQLTTNKLYLDDGQELHFSANSPVFMAVHPPHANSRTLGLARTITNLAIGTSPTTLGISLGISFLVNGLLSAKQNGIGDFFWGGFDGTGLSFLENLFRKQPDLFLESGMFIPFTLKEDLKISQGIQKEKFEHLNINKEEALININNFLQRGDLAGAIEYAFKTKQIEIYNELLKKIALN